VVRQHLASTRLTEGLGSVLLILMTSGCLSVISMETPQTVPEGRVSLVAAAVYADQDQQREAGFLIFKGRAGVAKHLDIGVRLDIPYLITMVDVKYQPLQTDAHGLDFAVLGGLGIPNVLHFQPLLGRQLGPLQVYTSYRFQLLGKPDLDADVTFDDFESAIHQVFVGTRWKVTPRLFCQGEGGYTLKYEILAVGVGCGVLFPDR